MEISLSKDEGRHNEPFLKGYNRVTYNSYLSSAALRSMNDSMMHAYENNTPTAWDDIRRHETFFETFASMYLREHPGDMLRLKREHTYKVLAHARAIVAQERLEPKEGRAALLAALYHDTGRFPQYVRWRTFSDAESENHGYLGVHVVKKEQFLADEPRPIRKWVLTAIALHNRYALPVLPEPYLTVTHVVRDADKLDIMRIMAQHLSRPIPTRDVVLRVQDAPQLWSQSIVDTVLSGGIPSYCDLHYVNDFRILLGSWIHDLHFPSSKKTCVASGFLQEVLQGLPDALELKPVTAYLLNQFSAVRNLCG